MNNIQLESLVDKLTVAGVAAFVTNTGIQLNNVSGDSKDLAAIILAVLVWWKSHRRNGQPTQPVQPTK